MESRVRPQLDQIELERNALMSIIEMTCSKHNVDEEGGIGFGYTEIL